MGCSRGPCFHPFLGQVFGELQSLEPQTIACQITATASRAPGSDAIIPEASASLQIRVVHFAYSGSALTFTHENQSFAPAFHGFWDHFELRCTPDLPWAQIDRLGTISQNGQPPIPRTAGCTASRLHLSPWWKSHHVCVLCCKHIICACQCSKVSAKGCLEGEWGNCTMVTRSTETVLVAANEPSELFLVSEASRKWVKVNEVSLVVGRSTTSYRLSSVLSSQQEAEIDPPVAYHVECGNGTRFEARRGVLTKAGERRARTKAMFQAVCFPVSFGNVLCSRAGRGGRVPPDQLGAVCRRGAPARCC